MSKYSVLINALLSTLLFAWAGVGQAAVTLDKVLVVVNDEPITFSEYEARYRQEVLEKGLPRVSPGDAIHRSVVEALVNERIQAQEAIVRGITVADQDVEAGIREIAQKNNMSVGELGGFLAKDGITLEQFANNVRGQQLIRLLVEYAIKPRVRVSEQEVDSYLDAHESPTENMESYELSHLFVSIGNVDDAKIQSEKQNLEFIRNGILEGQPFGKAVKAYSDSNKENEGYLGWRKRSQLPRVFIKELQSMAPGDISEVIQEDNGFHILQLHNRKGGGELVEQKLVRHILVQPEKKRLTEEETLEYVNELSERIRQGEEFESLARLYSDDRQTMDEGGSLGWVRPSELGAVIGSTVLSLGENVVSAPIRSPYGFHLIEVMDTRERDISQDLAERNARQVLFERKTAQLYRNWLDSLKSAAFIEYLMDIDG
ncbi:MAG: hypothetical protein GKR95_25765 [Gammaproteobacteria bacterium]|nr:hypothetical protein [Gammaproteobacteria bacterium]